MKALTKIMSLAALVITILLTSCNSDIEYTASEPTPPNYKITPDGAIENLKDFMLAFDASRSNSRSIKEVKAIRSKRHSRGGDACDSGDTLLYIINFEDNQGFALMGADERTEPIFAIVDEGNYEENIDTVPNDSCLIAFNPGWNEFFEGAEAIAEWDIWYNEGFFVTSKGWNILNKRSPMLVTKWGQSGSGYYTYGRYCPNNITGCTVTATAQILSLYQHINYIQWNYKGQQCFVTLNWMRIISDCKDNDGTLLSPSTSLSLDEIALLCRYLGIMFDAEYKSDKTSIKKNKPIEWFNKWSGLNATQLASYNEDNIIEAIRASNPVYARGQNYSDSGHAWVLDGYVIASRDNEEKKFLHCNWGWNGSYNGYYLSRVFNANAGAEIEDDEVMDSNSDELHFYKALEYSIISRP